MSQRLVLHADADAFFASVVLRGRPDLIDTPVAVTAYVFVASANYVARSRGVHGGMLAAEALRLCPDLVLIEVPRSEVEEASEALFDLFADCALAVEPGSMEEGFLDVGVTDWSAAREAAEVIRHRAAGELSLPISIGIGRTKLIAKLASRSAKPDGVRMIEPAEEQILRATLRLDRAWGVGGRTLERLTQLGAVTLGDLDTVSDDELELVCGVGMAKRLRGFRTGTDDSEVRSVATRTTLSSEGAIAGFRRPDHLPADVLTGSVARVCRRAIRAGLVGTGMTLTLKPTAGGPPLVRRQSFPDPSADVELWSDRARMLLADLPHPELSGIGFTLTRLQPATDVPATLF
ncbi:hypothetical protein [Williamsia maris]|uniref:DNA polymerase-4 n=1 Tax=Williamsia maris TaxID=72806 RepID=A0ABT1HFI6_9NOCA|nr:hypothetical protein [Williamsia maris]MCP2176495.1 DNA polymerase-4 [Williamsia maris]